MKTHLKKIKAVLLLTFAISVAASARPPEEAEFTAATHIGEDIAEWVQDREPRPNSLGIFSVHANLPLEQDFGTLVENEIIKGLNKRGMEKVTSCAECRNPQVTVQDDKVIIARGAPDVEQMKKIGKTQNVESFLMVEVYRTNLSVFAQVNLYENPSGKLIGAERFRVAALNFKDASVQVMLTLGLGKVVAGKGSAAGSGFQSAGNLLLLEELGFAKGGLNVGGVFGDSNLFYLNPTIAFRSRMGTSVMSCGLHLGIGYGLTSEARGLALRGAYELFLGTIAVLGLEGTYFIPDKSNVNTMKGFLGFHVGISLGR